MAFSRKSLCPAAFSFAAAICLTFSSPAPATAQTPALHRGYYSTPDIHGDTIVFTSEGDLWTISVNGGTAHRLTSDPGREAFARISPDGKTVAYSGDSEGPTDVYTMPLDGGMPQRRTWDGDAQPVGWTSDGALLLSTSRYSTLPGTEIVELDNKGDQKLLPLAQAAQASYSADGHTLFFTRWYSQPSHTKRYKGGTAESIWRYNGAGEAEPLTANYTGTSKDPMFWKGRVYFISDRDGVMNIYSMDTQGHDVKQESHQKIFDVESAALSNGRIVYASAGDLWLLDLNTGQEQVIPVTLQSDFDQMRPHWVKKPLDYLTAAHISPDGSHVAFTARGAVFSIPAEPGRIVSVASESGVRYRDAIFLPGSKQVVALSTKTGETELWNFPANGIGAPTQLTSDAHVQRGDAASSPDDQWIAYTDKDQHLWLYNFKTKANKQIGQSMNGDYEDLSWSPDSHWLAYVETANNQFDQVKILDVSTGKSETITSDRFNCENPAWSTDGKWLYFLSDRMLKTTIQSPWGPRQPDPHFDHRMKLYELALQPGERSPFLPADELHPDTSSKSDDHKASKDKEDSADKTAADKKDEKKPVEVKIDFTGLAERLQEIPVPAGNYSSLQAADKRLCWLNASDDSGRERSLQCIAVDNKPDENPDTVLSDVRAFEIALDRKKMLVRRKDDFFVIDASAKGSSLKDPKALEKTKLDLSHWTYSTTPRDEYRGIFLDAWRMERDYFYDQHMQGVDWVAMRERYLPLVDRVADRNELNDVIAQMVSELSALHTFVRGGDERKPADDIDLASLGAHLKRDEQAGGFVVEHIYAHDPDLPDQAPPLARPQSLVQEGEVITSIDGQPTLSVPDVRELLRGKAGVQVLLQVKSQKDDMRDVLVTPVSARDDARMRYAEWEYTRRLDVDKASNNAIGYVHLQAMGPNDIDQWARDYYPIFNRQGLIIDVRHNRGGNIDSWLLGKLLRKAWFYWQPRVGHPMWNMNYAFRGHIVVLCDQWTASDGEAFTEGFERFKMGKVIGMRTWGGEIWLSADNVQIDHGLASAAETGVYGPEGKWLIEGHGVEPDITVDDLPHATFEGKDAQLDAAIKLLQEEIKADPRPVPQHPPYPDKSFNYQK
ncbi:MAG: PD40 domain-containing protein [Acidobacteriota bacterium]|nr:PD40 domain-containing protein [Acidobacteriota bacterium]